METKKAVIEEKALIEELPVAQRKDNFDKLLKYLSKLNIDEPSAFRLSEWISAGNHSDLHEAVDTWITRYAKGEPLNCGTSACVVGHMPVIFPDNFRWEKLDRGDKMTIVSYTDPVIQAAVTYTEESWMSRFFGGSRAAWSDIIIPGRYDYDSDDVALDNTDQYEVTLDAVLGRLNKLYAELYVTADS